MKRAGWALAGVVALIVLLLAAVFVTAMTSSGFRWLADTASALSGDRLTVEGVDGHLGGPLAIQRLTFSSPAQRIEVDDMRLEWQPRALWQRRLEIDLLAARAVRLITLKKDPTPLQAPGSLRLPVEVRVTAIDVARLDRIEAGEKLTFRDLRGKVDGVGDHYRLTELTATTPWADLTGAVSLGKDAPFAVDGGIEASRRGPLPMTAQVALGGSLAGLQFQAEATATGMRFLASGEAAPFADVILPRLLVAGEGIDPRQVLGAEAPHANLAFSGVFEGRPGERVLGTFSLSNEAAGRLDQQRLPLANLTGAVFGDLDHAEFSALSADLGAAGQFSGSGQWREGRVILKLESPRLNLAGLHQSLYSSRLRTALQFEGDAATQTLDATLAESWGTGRFRVTRSNTTVQLESATLDGEAGKLVASGVLQLDETQAFSATFSASDINPARFGSFPRARLNARGEVTGVLAPALSVQAQFTLPPGQIEGRPVKGQGRVRYDNGHLVYADVNIEVAGNHATVKGAFGRAGDRLDWEIDAPTLARVYPGLAGRLTSTGSASGEPAQLQIAAQIDATGLRLPGDIAADALALQLDLEATPQGAFEGELVARGLRVAGQAVNSANATLSGRRSGHALAVSASLPEWQVNARLAGGLDEQQVWRGQLQQASAQGPWPMELNAPAGLLLSRGQQQVENLTLTLAGGRLAVARFARRGDQLASRGALSNLPVAPLLALLEKKPPVTTDLRLNGSWDLRVGDMLDGTVRLQRQSGDVRLTEPSVRLGLDTVALSLDAQANRVNAELEVSTRDAGNLQGQGNVLLERTGAAFHLPRGAPIAWTARLDVPDLRLAKAFLPVGIRLDSQLSARLVGGGSLAAPRVEGEVNATDVRFAMPEQGLAITDGNVRLALTGDRLRVQQGELKGTSGRLLLSGEAQLKNPQAGLTLRFEKFAATQRSDRRVIVSGLTQLNLDPKGLRLTGELTADRARLEMPEASRPTLSNDVVIVGRPARPKPAAQRIPLSLDLELGLGDDFLFKGAGLDARLGGRLRVFTVNEALRGEGMIEVEDGRYAAYGQSLDIERGVLRFAGPIENPGLDVLAVRKTPTVKVGVLVSGTVQRPLVKLYSEPPLPDTEKLAWLVLGHGLDSSQQQEFALLQVAAGALLSQAESVNLQATLAENLGIDTLDVRSGTGEDLTSTVVSVGKRLSSRATLSYEQSLDGLSQLVKILYQMTPRVRLEAQTGQQTSFDVFYTREYD